MKGKRLYLALILLVVAVFACALTPEQASRPLPQDPEVLSGRLSNGMSYYILNNKQPEHRAELRLYVNAGSVNEDDDQRGLAHFTEHMAFNGTKSFGRTEVVDYLTSIGMGFMNGLNAGTSYEFTYYMLKVPTDNAEQLRTGIQILSEMAHAVTYAPEELERERGIILEEWRLGQGPQQRVADATMKVLFQGSKYAERAPIGTEEVLRNFKRETIQRFYSDWYHPSNQSVVIVGDYDPEAMLALLKEFFAPIPAKENPRVLEKIVIPENVEPQVTVVTDPEFPYNLAQIIWKRENRPIITMGDYYDQLKQDLYCDMLSSRLEELSKKPNPSYSMAFAMSQNILKGLGGAAAIAIAPQGKSEEAFQVLLTEAQRVERFGYLPSEFDRAKLRLTRRVEQAVAQKATRQSGDVAEGFINTLYYGGAYISPEQEESMVKSLLAELSLEELNVLGPTIFTDKNMFISITGPESAKASLPTQERLLAIVGEAKTQELTAYTEEVIDKPLIPEKLKPGTIKKQLTNRKAGINIWTLSNGVKVYFKKTDFKQDEVLLGAWSPGGFSYTDAASLSSANLLSMYVSESGFGEFDATALQKLTAGKVANANLSLSLNSEGFNASCSPQDLELMFQMVLQFGTNPRFDEDDFTSFLQRMKGVLENSLLDPQSYFFDLLESAPYNDNPYTRSLHPDDLDKADLETVQRIFKDRFADFSDFSFVIVGNYDEAKIKDLVRTYLGSLPASQREESYKDVGIRPIQGISENRFQRGLSDRCFATLITTSPYKGDVATRSKLHALMYLYNEKLRENVRENLSGVYVVQAWPAQERYPSPHLVTNAFLACDPLRVDELMNAIVLTADSLRQGLFEDRYVEAAKITLIKTYEDRIKTNDYWLMGIMNGIAEDRPIDAFLSFPRYYQEINRQTVIDAANMFLPYDKNLMKLVMMPDEIGIPVEVIGGASPLEQAIEVIEPELPLEVQTETEASAMEPPVEEPALIEIEVTPGEVEPEANDTSN
jgi:zinc protease